MRFTTFLYVKAIYFCWISRKCLSINIVEVDFSVNTFNVLNADGKSGKTEIGWSGSGVERAEVNMKYKSKRLNIVISISEARTLSA